jgi:S1-C subfamily serine protease
VATVDWIALAFVGVSAVAGWRRGLVLSALSLAGLVAGAYLGSRLAGHLLSGGSTSRWTALAGLIGALAGAFVLQAAAAIAGSFVRGGLRLTPLRLLDSLGGIVFGTLAGLAMVWVCAAVALLLPGQTELRREVVGSKVVTRLNEIVPPERILNLLARIDPFPSILGPAAPATTALPRTPAVRRAARSVVKVTGVACGIGIEGSGWFVTRDRVVTNAHVVAGEDDPTVQLPNGLSYSAEVVRFDPDNDVAVLHVRGASATPLPLSEPSRGAPVAILGYPEDGPLTATAGRIGGTQPVVTRNAYGEGPVRRLITAVAGRLRHGNSGGPAVDRLGRVQATIFAARIGSNSGFGIPAAVVEHEVGKAQTRPVSTGDCAAP